MADAGNTGAQSLLLVDLSGLFWAAFHATGDQLVGEAYERTIETVHGLVTGHDLVAICTDCPPYERSKLLPSYKAQRAEAPPMAREQFERVKARLRADGYLLWGAPGHEADDVIAWAVQRANSDGGISQVVIASNDKDMDQLVSDRVKRFAPMSQKTYDCEGVREKHGVPPHQMLDYLSLIGDSSDNVPGVPGVGPKTAAALLLAFGDLESVLHEATMADDVSRITKPKLKASLVEHAEAARLARKIIALRTDLELDWNELRKERRQVEQAAEDVEFEDQERAKSAPPPALAVEPQASQLATVEPAPTRAPLAPAAPEWAMGLEPHDLSTAYKLAKALVQSRLYSKFANAEALWSVIIRGREMGLGALESLDSFFVVEGRPYPSAHLLIARAMKHPDCEYFTMLESTEKIATYETKRRGSPKPVKLSYTIEEAERAGVVKPGGNWIKRPAEMIRKTTAVQLARAVYPESLGGAYSVEEIQ